MSGDTVEGWQLTPASPEDDVTDPETIKVWRRDVDGFEVTLFEDEVGDFPPLADALADVARLRTALQAIAVVLDPEDAMRSKALTLRTLDADECAALVDLFTNALEETT